MFSQGQFLIDPNAPPEEIVRKREALNKIMRAYGRANNVGEGVGDLMMGLGEGVQKWRVGKAERSQSEGASSAFESLLGGGQAAEPSMDAGGFPSAPQGLSSMDTGGLNYRDAIASIESAGSGDYNAVGPTHPKLGRALGRYQVMEANIGPWSREALGREVSPDEFMANPQIQDAIFDKQFGGYVEKFGQEGAAQAWFAGPGGVGKTDRKDSLGTDVGSYGQRFVSALGQGAPQPAMSISRPDPKIDPAHMPAPAQTPMAQGRDGLAQALMQQQQAPGQQAIEQQMQPQEMDPRAQFNSPQLNAADPTRGILRVLMERGGQQGAQPGQPTRQVQQAMQGQSQGTQLDLNKAIELMNNPFLDAGKKKVLGVMIERQMAQQDPANQLDMEYKRAQLDQLRNPQPKQTDDIREYEFARQQGYQGSFKDFMLEGKKAGAVNITNTNGSQSDVGTIPPGFELLTDPATGARTMRPITGGPAQIEADKTTAAGVAKSAQTSRYGNVVVEDIDRAVQSIESSPALTTGLIGQWMGGIAGTPAHKVSRLLETVKANAGFDRLQAMRDSSPTGGALGQVSEREMVYLQAAIGSLEQSQTAEDLIYNLRRVQDIYDEVINGPGGASKNGQNKTTQSDGIPDGIDPADWEFLTPEERKLFQ